MKRRIAALLAAAMLAAAAPTLAETMRIGDQAVVKMLMYDKEVRY